VKLKALQENAKEIEQRADVASRQMIQESYTALAQQWRQMEDNLLQNISHLLDLADTWEVRIQIPMDIYFEYPYVRLIQAIRPQRKCYNRLTL